MAMTLFILILVLMIHPEIFEPIFSKVASIFVDNNERQGTKEYRLEWWSHLFNTTVFGEYFWTGRGFGFNLGEGTGFDPVGGGVVLDVVLVGSVAKGRVGAELTLTHFVVAAFAHVEVDRPVPSDGLVACGVAEGRGVTHSASAPQVDLALLQVHVVGVVALDHRQSRRRVPAFRVRNGFWHGHRQLSREVLR